MELKDILKLPKKERLKKLREMKSKDPKILAHIEALEQDLEQESIETVVRREVKEERKKEEKVEKQGAKKEENIEEKLKEVEIEETKLRNVLYGTTREPEKEPVYKIQETKPEETYQLRHDHQEKTGYESVHRHEFEPGYSGEKKKKWQLGYVGSQFE